MDGWNQVEVRHSEMEATVGNARQLGCEVPTASFYGKTLAGEPCYLLVIEEAVQGLCR